MLDFDYLRPASLQELAAALNQSDGRVVAGGTDVLPRLRRGQFMVQCLVDISRLAALHFINETDGMIQIGALTTHADLITSNLLLEAAPALVQAAATVGCPQTRQRGTIGGNLVNASPAADSAPPLLILDATVNLVSASTTRSLPLRTFFVSPGKTRLEDGEYLHHVFFPRPTGRWGMSFYKLGKRNGMAISIASAAAYLRLGEDGHIQAARLALGSVAPCPTRSPHAEELLMGKFPSLDLFQEAGQAALADTAPISDIRASREYRRHIIPILVKRVLTAAWQQAEKRSA